jgi:hypothetical protein
MPATGIFTASSKEMRPLNLREFSGMLFRSQLA